MDFLLDSCPCCEDKDWKTREWQPVIHHQCGGKLEISQEATIRCFGCGRPDLQGYGLACWQVACQGGRHFAQFCSMVEDPYEHALTCKQVQDCAARYGQLYRECSKMMNWVDRLTVSLDNVTLVIEEVIVLRGNQI